MKSGNLNFLEPSGPLQVCDGTALYDSEKENWRILTNKEIYASVKKTYYNRNNKVKYITLVWACTENGRK